MCIALYASLAYFCGTKAYLLTACMHTHLHALLRPPLSLPPFTKVFSESSTSSRVFRPTRKHRKRAQTVKMTKQYLGWCFTHTCHENEFGLTLTAKMIYKHINCREKGFDLRQMIISFQRHFQLCIFQTPIFIFLTPCHIWT